MAHQQKYDEYNSEPVFFCANCYSLKIGQEEHLGDYCMDCGSTNTKESSIEEWEKLYERRYGHQYIVKSNNQRKSPVFEMSPSKLQDMLYESPAYNEIITGLYPKVPGGLTKIEKVAWLFDKLRKDGRMDDLKFALANHLKDRKQ